MPIVVVAMQIVRALSNSRTCRRLAAGVPPTWAARSHPRSRGRWGRAFACFGVEWNARRHFDVVRLSYRQVERPIRGLARRAVSGFVDASIVLVGFFDR